MKNDFLYLNNLNSYLYFFFLSIIICLINYYINHYYVTEELFYQTYSGQLGSDRILSLFNKSKSFAYLTYLFVPVFLLIKVTYSSIFISISEYFATDKINISNNFNFCLKSEIVFTISLIVKILLLEFVINLNSIYGLNFIPLSLPNLFKSTQIPPWLFYPLQLINIWEILFIAMISYLFSLINQVSFKKGLSIAGGAYLCGLLFWAIFVSFITVQIS